MSSIEPGRLYDKCIDDVLSHLLATQEEGDPPQLRHEDVQRLPPDITHDLLHRLLSSSTLPRRRKTAPVSPKPTFTSWAAPAALEAEERAKRVNDELLALLVSPHLTHLRLRMCVRVTDLSFQRLFAPGAFTDSTNILFFLIICLFVIFFNGNTFLTGGGAQRWVKRRRLRCGR
jgi:hypothetical protein